MFYKIWWYEVSQFTIHNRIKIVLGSVFDIIEKYGS